MAYLELIYPKSDSLYSKDVPQSVVLHSDDTCKLAEDSLEEEVNRLDAEGIYNCEFHDDIVCISVTGCPVCINPQQMSAILKSLELETTEISMGECTFCGWIDPPGHFDFHTPGGAPVCHSCAVEGILQIGKAFDVLPSYSQGEGNYQSGRLRVEYKGEVLYQNDPKNRTRLQDT